VDFSLLCFQDVCLDQLIQKKKKKIAKEIKAVFGNAIQPALPKNLKIFFWAKI